MNPTAREGPFRLLMIFYFDCILFFIALNSLTSVLILILFFFSFLYFFKLLNPDFMGAGFVLQVRLCLSCKVCSAPFAGCVTPGQ